MLNIAHEINQYNQITQPFGARLIAISKTKPNELLLMAYQAGQRDFGENKVQELARKYEELPKDIKWHMVGHLQRNKIKYIAPFVHLIHSVDSLRLLEAIDKEAGKYHRIIDVLLQVYIASEETKFGLDKDELVEVIESESFGMLKHVRIIGLMGMASNTDDEIQVRSEFSALKKIFDYIQKNYASDKVQMKELSMGMSGDYQIALEEGSTMIRVGSAIFGERDYAN